MPSAVIDILNLADQHLAITGLVNPDSPDPRLQEYETISRCARHRRKKRSGLSHLQRIIPGRGRDPDASPRSGSDWR